MKVILSLILLALHILHADVVDVYFGTGGGEAKGLYRASLDTKKGKLSSATFSLSILIGQGSMQSLIQPKDLPF